MTRSNTDPMKSRNLGIWDINSSPLKVLDKTISKKERTNDIRRKNKLIQELMQEKSSMPFNRKRGKETSFGSLVSLDKVIEQSNEGSVNGSNNSNKND